MSRGGTSLLSCWMLMAFIKGADNRRDASFAVRPGRRLPVPEETPEKAKAPKVPKKAPAAKTEKTAKAAKKPKGGRA